MRCEEIKKALKEASPFKISEKVSCKDVLGYISLLEKWIDHVEEQLDRLDKLESKIADGRLIELPCKVGDTLYWVYWTKQKEPSTLLVESIKVSMVDGKLSIFVFDRFGCGGRYGDCRGDDGNLEWHVGKDKQIAEARLKELQGE